MGNGSCCCNCWLSWSRNAPKAGCRAFWERYPDAEQPLKAWYEEATSATWSQPADIKAQYRSASVLKNRRVVFNIKGNDYRLIVAIAYKLQIVYVKFVGTHKEYDAVDAETVEMA
jgi:mRNA interferase HigB